jgi:hypothetical protein
MFYIEHYDIAPDLRLILCRFRYIIFSTDPPQPPGEVYVQGKIRERWQELCELAATTQEPKKLLALTQEILQLLADKSKRLTQQGNPPANRHCS